MGITGKYNFKGIQKAGALGLKALLASTVWGAKILASPFARILTPVFKWFSNYMANQGLILINVGAYFKDGYFDQKGFDKAMDEGLSKVMMNPNISKKEGEAVDENVKKSVRKFFKYNKYNK